MYPCQRKGERFPTRQHRESLESEQMGMIKLGAPESDHCLIFPPGVVTLKVRTTVMILAKMVEIATVNTTPNVICWRMPVAVLGWPMKRKEQRKHRMRETSRMQLRARCLALTTEVSLYFTKTPRATAVRTDRQTRGSAGKDHPQRIFIGQEGHSL